MVYNTFNDFEAAVSALIEQENYEDALHMMKTANEMLPEHIFAENRFYILFLITVVYYIQKRADECIDFIRTSIGQGFIFPLNFSIYNFIRQHKDFLAIKQANDSAFLQAEKGNSFKYKVLLPEGYSSTKKYPLFICLHGDSADGNIPYHSSCWRSDVFLNKGYIAVYPQSSQMYCTNGFGWLPNPELSRVELKSCYLRLIEEYSIDESNVIIGGFSGGATTAIDIVLSNTISASGFIALCPGDSLDPLISEAKLLADRGVKGVILEGELETDEAVSKMLGTFDKAGLPYKYIINKNIGRSYPSDLDEKLEQAIKFITQ